MSDEPIEKSTISAQGPDASAPQPAAAEELAALRAELGRTRAARDALIQQALGVGAGGRGSSPLAAGGSRRASGNLRLLLAGLACAALLFTIALLAQRLQRLTVAAHADRGPAARAPAAASAPPAAFARHRIEVIPVPRLSWVGRAALAPDGELVAVAGDDGRALLLRLEDGKLLAELRGHQGAVRALAFAPDGQRLVTGGADGALLLHGRDGRRLATLSARGAPVRDLALGRRLLAVARDAERIELHALGGGGARTLAGHGGWVRAVALSSDERRLASGGEDEQLRLWDTATGKLVDGFAGRAQWINALAFSPDGALLAVAGFDKRVWLWDLQRKQPLQRLWAHQQRVAGLAFDRRGALLASAGLDRRVVVWDVRRGKHLHLLDGHERQVSSVLFDPAGRFVLSSSGDGTLRRWPLPPPSSPSVQPLPPPGPGELTLRGNTSGQRARVRVVDDSGAVLEEGRRRLAEILRSGPDDQLLLPDPQLVQLLYQIASHFGRQREILVISGYRSPRFNRLRTRQSREVGEKSQHITGKAIDLRIDGVSITALHRYARSLRRGGVGFYADSNFVHVDTGPLRYWSGD